MATTVDILAREYDRVHLTAATITGYDVLEAMEALEYVDRGESESEFTVDRLMWHTSVFVRLLEDMELTVVWDGVRYEPAHIVWVS